ncbi:unnamed protein product, partial [Discosporangium mesarthrocarpum]
RGVILWETEGSVRILKMPMPHRVSCRRPRGKNDNIIITCCILHNMLHAYDGPRVLEPNIDWAGGDSMLDAIRVIQQQTPAEWVCQGNVCMVGSQKR